MSSNNVNQRFDRIVEKEKSDFVILGFIAFF